MGISGAQALDSFRSDDLIGLGMEADTVRRRLHPEGVVSYAVVCRLACAGGSAESLGQAAEEMLERGGSGVSLGGAAALGVEGLLRLVKELRRRAPTAWISGVNASDARELAAASGSRLGDLFAQLHDAGWNSLSSDGPDLADGGASAAEWLQVHEAAHRAGVRTTASLRFGAGERLEDRVQFLDAVRRLHEQTGGFAACIPESAGGGLSGPTAVECLKTLAVSRLMLDAVPNVQVGWMASGLKVLEMGLRFGANDAGDVLVATAGRAASSHEEDLRRVIRDAGFMAVERDPGYRMVFVA